MSATATYARKLRAVFTSTTKAERQEWGQWYLRAKEEADIYADAYEVPLSVAAGVIAVLSQRQRWNKNLIAARLCLEGKPIGFGLPAPNIKAEKIRDGADPWDVMGEGSPKIRAFYQAILGDCDAVVLDSWMLKAMGWPRKGYTPGQYEKLAAILRREAKKEGLYPADYQAIVWCKIRGAAY